MKNRATFAVISALLACASGRADFTWDGSVNDFMSTNGNWVGGLAPGADVSDTLVFGDTMGVGSVTPDVAGSAFFNITAITFTAADRSYMIVDTGAGFFSFIDNGSITNDSAFDQTINVDLIATGSNFFVTAVMADIALGGPIDLSDTGGVLMTVGGGFDTTLSGVISGAGAALLKTGAGTLTLTGANTFDGGVQLADGTIILGHDDALGVGGTLNVTGDSSIESDDDLRNVSNDITVTNTVTLTVSGDFDLALSGVISGSGGALLKTGAGTLTLTGANTFDGGVQLADGTIILGHDDALGVGGTLNVTGDSSIESDDDLRNVSNDITVTNTVTLTVSGDFDLALSGVISGGGGALLKTGAGTLTLTGDNTYTGGTELAAGTIVLGHDEAIGNGTLNVTGDASLESDNIVRDVNNAVTIADMVTLTVSGNNDLLLRGVISGAGGMTVNMSAATDILSLNRANTFTGGMTLMQGTLRLGNNSALGAGDVSVVGDFTLDSDSDDRRFTANVDIDTGITLSFTGESLVQQFASVISGDGGLNINLATGADEMTLRGANTYTGGTTLTMGTIILADDRSLGTGALTLAGNGTIESTNDARVIDNDIVINGGLILTFDGTRDLQLDGVISGTGGLTLDASRVLTLAGASTYTGLTTVNNGAQLILDGTIGGALDVNSGGLLTGSGSMLGATSHLSIKTGGSVSPGSSVGTLTVEGNYIQETGSTYVVDLSATDGTSDLLDITGTATLASGSTIEASLMGDGYIASGFDFVIIEADGGIFDNGVVIMTDSATVTVDLVRDTGFMDGNTTWSLELFRAGNAYSGAADPGNNTAIGGGLDSLIPIADATPTGASADLLGRLDALNAADYNQAVRELSPEPFNLSDATTSANVRDFTTQQVTYLSGIRSGIEAAPIPMPGPPPGSMALAYDDPLILAAAIAQARDHTAQQAAAPKDNTGWGRYFKVQGVFADQDTTTNRTGFDATTFGGQFGFDYRFSPNFVAGLAVGYTFTDANLDAGLGDIEDQTIRAGPYMSYYEDDWYVDASVTFGWHMFDNDRNIPALGLSAHSEYDGYDITGYLGTGYHLELDWNLYLTPIASVLFSHFSYEGFSESGAGGANLTLPSRESDSLRSRIGANLAYRFPEMTLRPVPYIYMGWEHEFIDDDNIEAAFAAGGSPFLINVGTRDEDAFFIGGGVNLLFKKNMAAFLRIESVTASNSDAVGVAAGLSVAF